MLLETLSSPDYYLPVIFFIVAFAYSSVGLGGGSSYTALMLLLGMSTTTIPLVSLTLNLFVSSIGSFNFIRNKHLKLKLLLPFIVTSIPIAYVGGMLHLPREIFFWILFVSLLFVTLRIYVWNSTSLNLNLDNSSKVIVSLVAGSVLGFVAGTVGIGGGIYLVPLIIILGLGNQKEAAATGIIFVWLNSMAGLISRLQHNSVDLLPYFPLIIAVVLGGFLGSHMGASRFSPRMMEKILGIIVMLAVLFLAKKLFTFYI